MNRFLSQGQPIPSGLPLAEQAVPGGSEPPSPPPAHTPEFARVLMSHDQALLLEELGIELMRKEDDRAGSLLALVLQWRSLSQLKSNVVELENWSRRVPSA